MDLSDYRLWVFGLLGCVGLGAGTATMSKWSATAPASVLTKEEVTSAVGAGLAKLTSPTPPEVKFSEEELKKVAAYSAAVLPALLPKMAAPGLSADELAKISETVSKASATGKAVSDLLAKLKEEQVKTTKEAKEREVAEKNAKRLEDKLAGKLDVEKKKEEKLQKEKDFRAKIAELMTSYREREDEWRADLSAPHKSFLDEQAANPDEYLSRDKSIRSATLEHVSFMEEIAKKGEARLKCIEQKLKREYAWMLK